MVVLFHVVRIIIVGSVATAAVVAVIPIGSVAALVRDTYVCGLPFPLHQVVILLE